MTILTESWHPIGTPLAVKGLASLLLWPDFLFAGAGAMAGAMMVVAGLLPVEEGVTVTAVDMLLGAVVMLFIEGAEFGVVPATVGFIVADSSCFQ